MQLVEQGERPGTVLRADCGGELIEVAAPREARRLADGFHRDLLGSSSALVEDGERIAQRAVCNAGDEQCCIVL